MHFATVRRWFSKNAVSSQNVKPVLENHNEHAAFMHLIPRRTILHPIERFKKNRDRVVFIDHPTRPAWLARRHILCDRPAQDWRPHLERLYSVILRLIGNWGWLANVYVVIVLSSARQQNLVLTKYSLKRTIFFTPVMVHNVEKNSCHEPSL